MAMMQAIDTESFKTALQAPHLPECCVRKNMDILKTRERLWEVELRGTRARALATTETLHLRERALDGEEIPESERLRVLALRQESEDLSDLEARAPKVIARAAKEAYDHHQKCARNRFPAIAAQLDTLYTDVVRVLVSGLTLAKIERLAQTRQVLHASARAWIGSSSANTLGHNGLLPAELHAYFSPAPTAPPAPDALSLVRDVVNHATFAARLAAIEEG